MYFSILSILLKFLYASPAMDFSLLFKKTPVDMTNRILSSLVVFWDTLVMDNKNSMQTQKNEKHNSFQGYLSDSCCEISR